MFFLLGSNALGLPNRSLDFNTGGSSYLSMSDANFGAFDHTKFAVSAWVQFSASNIGTIIGKAGSSGSAFYIQGSSNNLKISYKDSLGYESYFISTTTFNDTNWRHILVHFDPGNGTSGNRIKMWVNGVAETASSSSLTATSIEDSTGDIYLGLDGSGSNRHDGKIYQLGFFSGRLPSIGEVYNSGKRDISYISNLYSYIHTNNPNITDDSKLTANWTNNSGVVLSSDIP